MPTYDDYILLIHPDDRKRIVVQFNNDLNDMSETKFNSEYRIIKPDDQSVHWLKVVSEISRNHAGTAERVTGFVYDVTEEKKRGARKTISQVT